MVTQRGSLAVGTGGSAVVGVVAHGAGVLVLTGGAEAARGKATPVEAELASTGGEDSV